MNTINQRNFDKEAIQWDENPGRAKLARDVADAIIKTMNLQKNSNVLDFGCGTGLITMLLQPHVGSVTGADSSKGMLGILEDKIKKNKLSNVFIQLMDFEKEENGTGQYDLIVSNMTLHHVSDISVLFSRWYGLLKQHGRVCFSDLDPEDGSFHADNAGVFHFGFSRKNLKELI